MSFFDKILEILNVKMTTPAPYGWFHLMMLVIIIALSIFMVAKFKNADDKKTRKILLIFSITLLVFEVYKQIIFLNLNNWTYA